MKSRIMKRLLIVVAGLVVVGVVAAGGLYAWLFWQAERLPDVVTLQVFVLYDCVTHGVVKGDQRYVSDTGQLEACGIPAASLRLIDQHGMLLDAVTADRRGEFRLFRNAVVDDPFSNLSRVDIASPRCKPASFPLDLKKKHSFYGESMSARNYRYEGTFRFFCDPAPPSTAH